MKSARIYQNTREKNNQSTNPPSSSRAVEQEKKKPENRMRSVQELAAQFDSPRVALKDPAEMTISERKALFENNKGQLSNIKLRTPQTNHSVIPARTTGMESKKKGSLEFYKKEKPNSPLSVLSSGKISLISIYFNFFNFFFFCSLDQFISKTTRPNYMEEQNSQDDIIIPKMSEMPMFEAPTLNPISSCQPKSNIINTVVSSYKESNLNQPSSGIMNFNARQFIDKNI